MRAALQALGHDPAELRGGDHPDGAARAATATRSRSPSAPATSSSCATCSTRSAPTRCASPTCCRSSTRARPSTSTWSRPSRWTTRSSTCSTPTPASTRIERVARRARRRARSPLADVDLALLVHERELDVLRILARAARRRRAGLQRAGAAQGHHLGARAGGRVPRLLPRLLRDGRGRRRPSSRQARLWLVEAARVGLAIGARPARRVGARVDVERAMTARSPARCCPTRPRVDDRRPPARSAASTCSSSPPSYGTPLFVYDEAHLRRPLPRGRGRVRRRRGLRVQGLPVQGHGPARARGGHAHRRGHGRRAPRGARRGRSGRRGSCCTATTSPRPSCARALDERRRAHRRRLASTSSTASSTWSPPTGCAVPRVMVRVTPGVEAHTHEFVAHRPGRLEVRLHPVHRCGRGEAVEARPRVAAPSSSSGIHMHIGSQVFVADFFRQAVDAVAPVLRAARPARAVDRRRPRRGLRRGRGARRPSPSGATPCAPRWPSRASPPASAPSPGRAIAASAAVTLYTVGTVKELPGIRTYVAVDGGMTDNPRPVLYGSGYEAFLPRAAAADRPGRGRPWSASTASRATCWCATRGCRPTSPWATSSPRPSPAPTGTRWAPTTTRCTRPAVVFVADGEARLVVRRETDDDLLRLDL